MKNNPMAPESAQLMMWMRCDVMMIGPLAYIQILSESELV